MGILKIKHINHILFGILSSTFINPSVAQEDTSKIWPNQVYQFNNSRLDDIIDSELDFLSQVLSKKKIVFLGEGEHGDGQTIHAKTRIIKYLVERMGFEVVIFEYPFYEMNKVNDLMEDKNKDHSKILNEVFSWDEKIGVDDIPLKEWMVLTKSICTFEGLEVLYHSRIADLLAKDLVKFGIKEKAVKDYIEILRVFNRCGFGIRIDQNVLDKKFLKFKLHHIDFEKKILVAPNSSNKKFIIQVLYNNLNLVKHFHIDNSNIEGEDFYYYQWRDKPMFENFMYHLTANLNKKLIVSTSTYHITRGLSKSKTMVDYLPDSIADKSYFLPFIYYQGLTGRYYEGSDLNVEAVIRPKGYLEEQLHRLGSKYGFIDFGKLNQLQLNHMDSVRSSISPVFTFNAKWSKIFNGLFFIETMTPNYFRRSSKEHNAYIDRLIKPK